MGKLVLGVLFFIGAVFLNSIDSWSQEKRSIENKRSSETNSISYPRINLYPCYEVDPGWPKKPSNFTWEAMSGVAVDQQDNIWVFTRSKPPVQVYRPNGTLVRAWGEKTIGKAHHIKIDHDGNVWVADLGLHVVRKFSPEGEILMTLGTPGVPGESDTHLNKPTDMAISAGGDIFVSDGYGNNRVVHFDRNGKFVKEWGKIGVGPKDLSLPHAIAIDSKGKIYVADRNNIRIQIYNQQGELLDSWANIIVPWGFCMNANDELWVCGCSPMPWSDAPDRQSSPLSCPPKDQILIKFSTSGRVLQLWAVPKGEDGLEEPGEVNWLHAIAEDSKGNLYLGDIVGKRAQKFTLQKR